jgi:hypothetical protein
VTPQSGAIVLRLAEPDESLQEKQADAEPREHERPAVLLHPRFIKKSFVRKLDALHEFMPKDKVAFGVEDGDAQREQNS